MEWIYSHFDWTWNLRGISLFVYNMYLGVSLTTLALAMFGAFISEKFSIKMLIIFIIEILAFFLFGFVI
ncbi:MAG: hypothetical protein ACRDB0_08375 [Paraclostridium sp.]